MINDENQMLENILTGTIRHLWPCRSLATKGNTTSSSVVSFHRGNGPAASIACHVVTLQLEPSTWIYFYDQWAYWADALLVGSFMTIAGPYLEMELLPPSSREEEDSQYKQQCIVIAPPALRKEIIKTITMEHIDIENIDDLLTIQVKDNNNESVMISDKDIVEYNSIRKNNTKMKSSGIQGTLLYTRINEIHTHRLVNIIGWISARTLLGTSSSGINEWKYDLFVSDETGIFKVHIIIPEPFLSSSSLFQKKRVFVRLHKVKMQKNGIGTLRHYKNMTLLNYTSNEMEKNKNWSLFPNTQSITTQEHERLEQLRSFRTASFKQPFLFPTINTTSDTTTTTPSILAFFHQKQDKFWCQLSNTTRLRVETSIDCNSFLLSTYTQRWIYVSPIVISHDGLMSLNSNTLFVPIEQEEDIISMSIPSSILSSIPTTPLVTVLQKTTPFKFHIKIFPIHVWPQDPTLWIKWNETTQQKSYSLVLRVMDATASLDIIVCGKHAEEWLGCSVVMNNHVSLMEQQRLVQTITQRQCRFPPLSMCIQKYYSKEGHALYQLIETKVEFIIK